MIVLDYIYIYIYIYIYYKQNTITNPYRLFHPLGDHQGDLNQHNKTLKTIYQILTITER